MDKVKQKDIKDTLISGFKKDINIIYINYNKSEGIKILNDINELSSEDFNHFYKIHVFNEEMMKTVIKFDEDDFRLELINLKEEEATNIKQRSAYLKENHINNKYKKINYITGNIIKEVVKLDGELDLKRVEVFQYTGFES